MLNKYLIKTIKERRKSLKLTQEEVAKQAGVGVKTLRHFETGKSNPTVETIHKIADVLGLEISLKVKTEITNETLSGNNS